MIELPESTTISKQISDVLKGKTIVSVKAGATPHGFTFYNGDVAGYPELLENLSFKGCDAFGGIIDLRFDDVHLTINDGVNIRYTKDVNGVPERHQLLMKFDDSSFIFCTVQMYGGIMAFRENEYDNLYYSVAKEKPSPLSDKFDKEYFSELFTSSDKKLSAKAFLATEQRIPGLGNGVLQDILFNARIDPKRKIGSLDQNDVDRMFSSVKTTLEEMTSKGGRDTEKDLFGNKGGYVTVLSAKTLDKPCPVCGSQIVKKAYLGGNVYFCPTCQGVN